MRVLVIPDIHLRAWMFDCAEEILNSGKADRAVCLMDIPDDWDMQLRVDKYEEAYDRAISFAKTFPDTLWCYGNHDVSYPWAKLESGYSPYAEHTVILKLQELEESLPDPSQIAFVQRIDNVLFSHGGLACDFVKKFGEEMLVADIDEVLDVVNKAEPRILWNDMSPLWLRTKYNKWKMFSNLTQVVGHTPVDKVCVKNGTVMTDVFSTRPDGQRKYEPEMMVIDSVTGKYEVFPVNTKAGIKEVLTIAKEMDERYGEVFSKLADWEGTDK